MSPQALKPSSGWARPLKYKKKNFIVDRPWELGYCGILSSFDIFPLGKLAKVSQQRKDI